VVLRGAPEDGEAPVPGIEVVDLEGRLDPVRHKDRMGRWTETFYDALRRPVATRDAAGRVVQQQYCKCGGAVEKLVDANGNATSWERDLQGRVTKEIRANGATYRYAYEPESGRLLSVTDPPRASAGWASAR